MKRIKEFDYLKIIAVFSIMAAHLSPVSKDTILNTKISWSYNAIGVLGVPIFFLISGYLFYNNKKSLRDFFKNKFVNIIIPWLFVGTLCYFFVFYFQHTLSPINYLKFIVGYGSYLYYLLVLNLLYLLLFKLKNNKYFLILSSFLSIISITLTMLFGFSKFSYINVFNWLIYFNFGIILNKYKLYDIFKNYCFKFKWVFLLIFILVFVFSLILNKNVNYWSFCEILLIWSFLLFCFGLVQYVNRENKFFNFIGINSLTFYLIHMPIAGVVVRVTNVISYLIFFRLIITFLITYMIIYLYKIIINKLKLNKLNILIGVK